MITFCCVMGVILLAAAAFDLLVYCPAIEIRPDVFEPERFSVRTNGAINNEDDMAIGPPIITKKQYYEQLAWYWKTLLCFSLYSNGKRILNTDTSGQLECVHGIRVLSMAWIIMGHCYYYMIGFEDNLSIMMTKPSKFLFQIVNNATVSVDVFFLLSGFLMSYLFLKKVTKDNMKSPGFWSLFYVHRYLRLTPTYMILLGLLASVWPLLGEGPQWKGFQEKDIVNCGASFWTNLVYLNNFFHTQKQCIGWTWYLANDMQFYVFSPPVLVLLWFLPLVGVGVCVGLVGVSALVTALITADKHYPPTVISTIDPTMFLGLGDYFREVYSKPYCRWSPFVIGILLGYYYLKTKGTKRIPKVVAWLLWVVSVGVTFAVVFGLYPYAKGGSLSTTVTALYGAVNRTAFATALGVMIYLCLQGHGGLMNWVLSWKLWIPFSRLTYCAYLLHPMTITFYYSTSQLPFHASDYFVFTSFLCNFTVAYGLALICSLAFEAPFIQLQKLWLDPVRWQNIKRGSGPPTSGIEPVRDRLTEVRFQLQEGLRRMQASTGRLNDSANNIDSFAPPVFEAAEGVEFKTPPNSREDPHPPSSPSTTSTPTVNTE